MKNSLNQQTIEDIKKEEIPIIIFGASTIGEALFYECRKTGIKVECFCDNNINKTEVPLCNLEVIHPSDLKKKYQEKNDDIIQLIQMVVYLAQIYKQL